MLPSVADTMLDRARTEEVPARSAAPWALLPSTAAAGLFAVVLAGLWLRALLAALLPAELAAAVPFAHLRHFHMHAGYYGLLFPLLWLATAALGAPAPGRRLTIVYALACAVALAGFLRAGYGFEAIAGSTVVGAVWNIMAVRARGLLRERSWLRTVPVGVVVGTLFIPPIAVFTRRDPPFAQELVHSFLAVLVFLAFLPAALARAGARPVPLFVWLPLALLAAGFVGALHHSAFGLALTGMGAAIVWSAAPLERPHGVEKAGFFALGAAMIPVGLGVIPWARDTAIAAIHATVLGPLLVTLLPWPGRWGRAFQALGLALAFAMAGALLLPRLGVDAIVASRVSLACGGALLVPLGRAFVHLLGGRSTAIEPPRPGRR